MRFKNSTRRDFLKNSICAAATTTLSAGFSNLLLAAEEAQVSHRVITKGPKHHWFGYYDKLEMDPSQRYVLSMEVDFEHRSPTADDEIGIGMVDLQQDDLWVPLGKSSAWGWQQGCMLQWLPGSDSKIIWNDRGTDNYICHIMDVFTAESQTINSPVYTVSPKRGFRGDCRLPTN
ncbi:MAG: twin-arginine translocation signal domain-containing protein [Planctomycetaceae bacterium]